jgi:hypothetical protein
MALSGVESVRVVFDWHRAQPRRGQQLDFSHTDRLVEWASERDIVLLPVLEHSPPWARVDPSDHLSPPLRLDLFADFARDLVARYGPNGTFWIEHPELPRAPLREWQVLNEPNIRTWRPGSVPGRGWPEGYVHALRAAYRAIKGVDPEARVVAAGFANKSWRYLARLYRAGGRHWFDAVATHPYTATPRRVARVITLFRRVMRRWGDARKEMYVTEVGWTASRGRIRNWLGGIETTDGGVAGRLRRTFGMLARRHERSARWLRRLYYYTWASSFERSSSRYGAFLFAGLVLFRPGEQTAPRSALSAFTETARVYEGCRKTALGECEP